MGQVKTQKKTLEPAKNSPILLRLARLTRSLTQAQKRDFKKYVKFWSGKGGRKYLRLFDALSAYGNAGKEENLLTEHLLTRKKFGQKPAELSAPAQYLYRKILESLRTTPEGAPHLVRLNALLQDILFLYNKNLLKDCLPLIEEARALAQDLDKPGYELELLLLERRARIYEDLRHPEEYFLHLRQEEERLQLQIKRFNQYNSLAYELQYRVRSREPVPERIETDIRLLLESLREGALTDLSPRLKVRLYTALAVYHELKHTYTPGAASGLVKLENLKKSLHYQEAVVTAYRSNRFFLEEEQANYASSLEAYLNRCLRLGETEQAERYMAALEEGKDELLLIRSVAYIRLQQFIRNNEFRQARDYIRQRNVAAGIERFKNRFYEARLLALRFTCGQVFFCLDDFDGAGDWFGQIAAMQPDVRPDAVWLCKLLEIICLFELGTYRNEANPVRPLVNYGRALRRAKAMHAFNEQLLEAVGMVFRHPRALTKAGLPELLTQLLAELARTPAYYLYGIVLAWLETRLNRSSVGQEIRKYNR